MLLLVWGGSLCGGGVLVYFEMFPQAPSTNKLSKIYKLKIVFFIGKSTNLQVVIPFLRTLWQMWSSFIFSNYSFELKSYKGLWIVPNSTGTRNGWSQLWWGFNSKVSLSLVLHMPENEKGKDATNLFISLWGWCIIEAQIQHDQSR